MNRKSTAHFTLSISFTLLTVGTATQAFADEAQVKLFVECVRSLPSKGQEELTFQGGGGDKDRKSGEVEAGFGNRLVEARGKVGLDLEKEQNTFAAAGVKYEKNQALYCYQAAVARSATKARSARNDRKTATPQSTQDAVSAFACFPLLYAVDAKTSAAVPGAKIFVNGRELEETTNEVGQACLRNRGLEKARIKLAVSGYVDSNSLVEKPIATNGTGFYEVPMQRNEPPEIRRDDSVSHSDNDLECYPFIRVRDVKTGLGVPSANVTFNGVGQGTTSATGTLCVQPRPQGPRMVRVQVDAGSEYSIGELDSQKITGAPQNLDITLQRKAPRHGAKVNNTLEWGLFGAGSALFLGGVVGAPIFWSLGDDAVSEFEARCGSAASCNSEMKQRFVDESHVARWDAWFNISWIGGAVGLATAVTSLAIILTKKPGDPEHVVERGERWNVNASLNRLELQVKF